MRKNTRLLRKDEVTDLVETLYSRPLMISSKKKTTRRKRKFRPKHYKIVCISLYRRDIDKLEHHVRILKSRGYTKANKSQIIRFALDRVAIDQMPRMY